MTPALLGRRALLAGASVALAAADHALALAKSGAPATVPPGNPDTALMAACAEFEAVERRIIETSDGPNAVVDDDEAEQLTKPLWARQFALLDTLDALPTHTEGGLRARLRLLSVHNAHGKYSWDGPDTISGRLLRQAMQLGAREAPAAGQISEHPDGELLRLCAEWDKLNAAFYAVDDDDKNAINAACDRLWALTDRIEAIAPETMAGHAAKARIAVALLPESEWGKPDDSGEVRVALSTLRGIAAAATA